MSPCHPFRPVPGQCGPSRRGPLPAPPFDPRDYWATRKCVSELSASLEKKLDKADVVDPGAATEAGKAADAKKTQEGLNGILAKLAEKADSATTLAGYGITDAATKTEIAAKADLVGGKVPAAQLPSYVDEVLEYGSKSEFPSSGESGRIYVAKDTNLVYRWSGTQYVEISPSPTLDDAVTETSSNGVKSSGVWSWVKSLLPQWLTSDYAEPATVESVEVKADKATTLAGYGITDAVPFVEDVNGNKTAVTIGLAGNSGHDSLANGEEVTASGNYSHSEGSATIASGGYSHAEGSGTTAAGEGSHAEGSNTTASGTGSHTDGINSRTRSGDQFAFAWNGDDERTNPYASHGPGTFNINPVGGLAGFYIGEQTLPQVINAAITGKADIASLAPEYSATSAYSVGSIVYHDGNIYQCKTAIAEGGEAWNAEHWELRKLDGFFTESNGLLTGTIDDRLPIPISAKSAGFTTESYKRFVVTVSGDMTVTLHTPTSGDAEIFECRFNGASLSADASITFAGATATTMDANCGTVTAGKVALMSAFWNGTTWDVNWKVEG